VRRAREGTRGGVVAKSEAAIERGSLYDRVRALNAVRHPANPLPQPLRQKLSVSVPARMPGV
jgi:hypothetical protein